MISIIKYIKKILGIGERMDYHSLVRELHDLYYDLDAGNYSPRDTLSIYSHVFRRLFNKRKIRIKDISVPASESYIDNGLLPILSILWIRKLEENLSTLDLYSFKEYYYVWSDIKICIMRFDFIELSDWPMSAESILGIVCYERDIPRSKIEEIYGQLIEITDKILNNIKDK